MTVWTHEETMLPKSDGPSIVKKMKLPERETDILDVAEGHVQVSQESLVRQAADEINETVDTVGTSNESAGTICESYGSSVDLGYSSIDNSLHVDLSDSNVSEANDLPGMAHPEESWDLFGAGDYDYNSILFQFGPVQACHCIGPHQALCRPGIFTSVNARVPVSMPFSHPTESTPVNIP
ncbi:hypothetical protein PoB_003216200 [Plakobranchus ocellatus]|uniref:Uncharacterized protein n=1 Tax=Plakobranchus ocellatus TaxID=259542 RepID=A0AAV4AF69_9GAST|nr:hypothetical protein PoB_003216200 [Plakobranchus ocellatus]